MDHVQHIRRLLRYDVQANREAERVLKAHDSVPAEAIAQLGHIIAAEQLWLYRLGRGGNQPDAWPDLTLEQCVKEMDALESDWRRYLAAVTDAQLHEQIDYANSKGEPWTNTVEDILLQVVMHSSYHRGQIATILRQHGVEPAYTDFIHFVRQGMLAH